MTVQDIADAIGMTCVAGSSGMDREVTSGYASDLLSDAMGHAQDITGQSFILLLL